MGMVGAFIAVAIMLGIGTLILGGATTDCTTISDYDPNATTQTGWAGQCEQNNQQAQAGYGLLMITLIVISAVVILSVVRMLA